MKQPHAYNYVVGFFDLLGQRRALQGQGLLQSFASADDERAFVSTLRRTIGSIAMLQRQAEDILRSALRVRRDSPLRKALSKKERVTWDEMHRAKLSTQRWSDGLVNFICLGDKGVKCPMSGVYVLLGMAGALCYLGLASRRPVRGAIDVAWGVELHPGELYGAAIARAYELESQVAQWPRIVLGNEALGYLHAQRHAAGTDPFTRNNQALAEICLAMLKRDSDECWIVDYLGSGYRAAMGTHLDPEMHSRASKYIAEQIAQHDAAADAKLLARYQQLRLYFEANPPVDAAA